MEMMTSCSLERAIADFLQIVDESDSHFEISEEEDAIEVLEVTDIDPKDFDTNWIK